MYSCQLTLALFCQIANHLLGVHLVEDDGVEDGVVDGVVDGVEMAWRSALPVTWRRWQKSYKKRPNLVRNIV